MTPADHGEPRVDQADRVAEVVLAVPGVTGLHGGAHGVGTYLPGRRVLGVRLGPEHSEIHVTVAIGTPVPAAADAIARAVGSLTGTPVDVYVEDVTSPGADPGAGPGPT